MADSRPIVPVAQLGTRTQEQGRIRLGVKTQRAMKSIDTFRFTSPDEEAIRQIAELYGGEPRPWNEPKANPPSQWEVITTSTEIRVFLPDDALSTWYEQWTGGGCVRRCDGVNCETIVRRGDDTDSTQVPCLCIAQNHRQCDPHTRLNVILPEIRFGGVWRLETKGWNAAHEMPRMEQLINQLQGAGLLEGILSLEKAQSQGGRRKFVVPRLRLATSALQLLAGQGRPVALHPGDGQDVFLPPPPKAIEATGRTTPPPAKEWYEDDDEPVEAELVQEGAGPTVELETKPSTDGGYSALDLPGVEGSAGGDTSAERNGTSLPPPARQRQKLYLSCRDAAEIVGIDQDLLRHALCRKASRGRTISSGELTWDEASEVIDNAEQLKAETLCVAEVISDDPPHIRLATPPTDE